MVGQIRLSTITLVILIILGVQINFSSQQITHVPICASPDGYEIYNLTKPSYWQFEKEGGCVNDTNIYELCTFFFSFCHPLTDIDKCVNSSVCQFSLNRPDEILELGEYAYDPFIEKEINGFYAVFGVGETVVNKYTNETCNVSIVIEFDCDPSVPWISDGPVGKAPKALAFSGISEYSCEYYVKFPYAGACFRLYTTSALNPSPAKVCVPPAKGYNITVLKEPPYWTIDIESGCSIVAGSPDACTIFVAFCKEFESLPLCNGSSACIKYPNKPQNTLVIGQYTGDPFISAEANGFTAKYPAGSTILNPYTNASCSVSVAIQFDCDSDAEWHVDGKEDPGKAPKPTSFVAISPTSCQINITVPYSGACFHIAPSKQTKGLSSGSILIIIFVIAAFLYVTIGFGYNTLVDKQNGVKALPHYEFWVTSADYTKNGFVFIWKKVYMSKVNSTSLQFHLDKKNSIIEFTQFLFAFI